MSSLLHPELRPIEILPGGDDAESLWVLRDPEGFGRSIVLHDRVALMAGLMNGRRTLSEIQSQFAKDTHVKTSLADVEELVRLLDDARLLNTPRFQEYRRQQIEAYLANPVRPASHAGGAYHNNPAAVRKQLDALFDLPRGPGPLDRTRAAIDHPVCGVLSPHIDPNRGGAAYAWAYHTIAQRTDADLFVIFGTAHQPTQELFSISRKDFATPLGTVRTNQPLIDRLAADLASSVIGRRVDVFADELAHRTEHSIEFQALLLQHVLGPVQEFQIVPILVGSFYEFVRANQLPADSLEVQAFLAAVRSAVAGHAGRVCYLSGADFAHIGQQFGDPWRVTPHRLTALAKDDGELLTLACCGDTTGFFRHVARDNDRNRICGLAPIYTMLEVLGPTQGELLTYNQAAEPDGSACVSFASVAFSGC